MKTLRSRYVRRVLVPVIAVSLVSACGKWTAQEIAPSQVIAEREPGRVRLTMLSGEKIELYDPTASNGEIVGETRGGYDSVTRRHVMSGSVRVATDSVARVEIRETDALATVLVVTLGLASIFAVADLIFVSEFELYGG